MARCARCVIFVLLCLSLSVSGQVRIGIVSFNAGEVSPLMEGRIDFGKYNNACRTLQNMIPLTLGPVSRRPGTKYIADVKDANYPVRLIPFEYSKTDSYVLEFGEVYMRVFRDGEQVLDANNNPYTLVSPYDAGEVAELQYVQYANEMYMVHPNEPPQLLVRYDHDSWDIADVNFVYGPFLDENIETNSNITPSAITGTITLQASQDIFDGNHIGVLWKISHRVSADSIHGVLDADESSASISCGGDFDLKTKGTWTSTVVLQRSTDGGTTWKEVTSAHSQNDTNIEYSGTETDAGVIYRVTMIDDVSGSCTYNLGVQEYIHNGIVRIVDVNDANTAVAAVLITLASTDATTTWAEGAWSDYRGWPQTVEFHEERLIFGGTETLPQTVWCSTTTDPCNFWVGVEDDDSFAYMLPGQNPIQWMLSQSYLMLGTLGGAGRLGKIEEEFTPTNPMYRSQSRYGSAYIQAVLAGDSILYVERGGNRVREFVYSLETDKFTAPDMSILAPHITSPGITQTAYQSRPDSTLWCVLDDGDMACLTYEREQEVVAWSLHTTDGNFESACVIPGTDEDELWVVVNRDGGRYVELFQPRDWGEDYTDCWFVDSGLRWDGGDEVVISAATKDDPILVTVATWPVNADGSNIGDGNQVTITNCGGMTQLNGNVYTIDDANVTGKTFTLRNSGDTVDINSIAFGTYTVNSGRCQWVEKTFTGLGHLEGQSVSVYADGDVLASVKVASNSATIANWSNKVLFGLPYESILESMPIVFETREGTSISVNKRIMELAVDFYETMEAEYGASSDDLDEIDFTADEDVPFTGLKRLPFIHGWWDRAVFYLATSDPVPVTIRSVTPSLVVGD